VYARKLSEQYPLGKRGFVLSDFFRNLKKVIEPGIFATSVTDVGGFFSNLFPNSIESVQNPRFL
jgi:hypothetical protein